MDTLVCLTPPCAAGALTSLDLVRLAVAAWLGILFLQSGIDKIVDRRGNVEWLTGHFAKSPLASQVLMMLSVVTAVELAAGALSALGVPWLLITGSRVPAALGALPSATFAGRSPALLSVTALLVWSVGPRLGEGYAGAAALVPYFILASCGLSLMGLP